MVQAVPEHANSHIMPDSVFSKGNEKKVLKLFDRLCPGINEEITGFSDILKVPAEQILYYALSYMEPGCSQMALLPSKTENGHTLIVRNYDFSEKMDDMMLCTTKINGRYAHIASSSVLFGRSDGMNECGLAVTMTSAGLPVSNMEGAPRRPAVEGLVYWAVIRSVLENCANVEDAIHYVKEMPIAFNLNLLVADKSNRAALMETYDGRFAVKCINESTPEQTLYSTNHVCLPELSPFEAVVGESIGSYLRTRRMNRAANDLIYTNKRILDIAMEYRFGSQEGFTRAFKKSFQLTPGAYRKNRIEVIVGNKTPITPSKLRHFLTGITIQPRIIDFEGALIVGIRGVTTIRKNKIPLI